MESTRNNSCIFCKIINRTLPGTIVHETETVLALIPLDQVSPGHTLLIPRAHYQDIFDIDESILAELAIAAKHLSKTLIEENAATGINILHASGADAQQSVFHLHIHLVPRYKDDGLDLWLKNSL